MYMLLKLKIIKLDLTPMNLAVQLQEKEILKYLVAAKHKIKQFDFESLR